MTKGRLILMPNTLDFGVDDSLDLREVLPQRVIETAARLTHWAAENAKTTRSLLKRVDAIAPLARIILPHRISAGTHACWVEGDRIHGENRDPRYIPA